MVPCAFFAVLIFVSLSANADWAFKSFAARKIQTSKSLQSGDSLLVMIDSACMEQERRLDKYGRSPMQTLGLQEKHNTSAPVMRFRAVDATVVDAPSAAHLETHPCVAGVTENARVQIASSGDPLISRQTALPAMNQSESERFFYHPLWGIRTEVNIAIVDTGIEYTHPDLSSRMWTGSAGERGWDFVNGDADPNDDSGHGTHVAGIIAAQAGNGLGIRGLVGRHARLMPVKSQDQNGGGNMSDVVNAIRWAVDNGAEVLNLSLTSSLRNPALEDAVQYALALNSVMVVASGNDGQEITSTNFLAPVAYSKDYLGLLGVGSFDALSLLRSTFSNFSSTYVEYSAPGSSSIDGIYSTFRGGTYRGLDGTSMAAPQVAGASALAIAFLKSNGIPYSPAQIELLIQNSATKDANLNTTFINGQRLNLERLGRLLLNSSVVDSTGGFDEP